MSGARLTPGSTTADGLPVAPETTRERVTAELTAALLAERESPADALSDALTARLIADGQRWFAAPAAGARDASPAFGAAAERADATAVSDVVRIDQGRRAPSGAPAGASPRVPDVWRWTGWIAAAAAFTAWVVLPGGVGQSIRTRPVASEDAGARGTSTVPDAGRLLRDALLAANPRALVLPWSATEDVAAVGATGDMLWSADAQRGVMRIVGLAANDPRQLQYQLWIFDATRDERYPVDGGVFDVPAGASEVLVPVQPRVPIGDATLFAVTVERPGGVVVSDRERIVLLAQR